MKAYKNSFHELMNEYVAVETIAGPVRGNIIVLNIFIFRAPSIFAASVISFGIVLK